MAYVNTEWKDHVMSPANTYNVTENSDGTVTATRAGTVVQQGTNMSASNFNHMEEGISEANEMALFLTDMLLKVQGTVNGLVGEQQEVTLTNSESYPFNNSQATVSLENSRNTKNYRVLYEILSKEGESVGDVIVSDKLLNGFKIRYTGAATSVTMNVFVIGGM